ncbi:hypothetical protein PENTCL1PPCAC_19511, partial [Pristionchus entomophagus]
PVHINLVIITLEKMAIISVSFVARLVMILFESGIVFVPNFGCHPIPLLNRIRLIWIVAVLNYNGICFAERFAATYFVRDYECNRRIYIAFGLIIADLALIFAVIHVISNVTALLNEYAVFLLFFAPNFYFFYAHGWLLRRNQNRLDRLNCLFMTRTGKSRDVYTLSLRLQLDENIWCLKQISASNRILIVGLIGTGVLVIVPPLFSYSDDSIWILQSFVVFTNMAMPTVALIVIVSIGISLDRFRALILPQFILDRIEKNKKNAMIDETPRHREKRVVEESNVYFSHLADVWECDARVHM